MSHYAVLVVFPTPLLDRFLLVQHRQRGWELPGGRVEPGERPDAAARREWQEETGFPLARLEPLGVHERRDGSTGHLFLGATHDRPGAPVPAWHGPVDPTGGIVAASWVDRLDARRPLAFPDDPYEPIARAIAAHAADATRPWELPPDEDSDGLIARLSRHPDARPRGDPFRATPAGATA